MPIAAPGRPAWILLIGLVACSGAGTPQPPPPAPATDTPGPNGFYDKYGIYGVLGKPPAGEVSQVEWRNVRYYRK